VKNKVASEENRKADLRMNPVSTHALTWSGAAGWINSRELAFVDTEVVSVDGYDILVAHEGGRDIGGHGSAAS
jgi:hypothetical protein